jgi:hypothetical protein
MLYFDCVHFIKGINMKKIGTYTIRTLLCLILFSSTSIAEVNNPFTIKGPNEFTLEDQNKLEDKIQNDINRKILSLENKMNRNMEELRQAAEERQQAAAIKTTSDNDYTFNTDINGTAQPAPEPVEKESPITLRLKKSAFLGCIDDQAIFKDNRTRENYFVSIEEAENNEEFSKMGGCSF